MATHRIPILGFNTMPDTSGNVYFDSYPNLATNDLWDHGHWCFANPSADLHLHGVFAVPQNYVGTAKIIVVWTSTVTSGNFGIEFAYRAVGGDDSESLDQNSAQETVNDTDVAPGATDRRMEKSLSLTSANLAAGDTVEFRFTRDDSADSLAGIVQLVQLLFEYADA